MPKRAWFNFRTFVPHPDYDRSELYHKWTTVFVDKAKKEYIDSISWQ